MTVEIGDLYDPTKNELVFVKIGTPQKLGYVIDQSLNTLKIFQTGTTSQPTLNGVEVKPKKLCLWIVLQRSKTLNKISEIKSLIFLMKLNEWQKSCRNAGFESVLRVSYIQNNA
ncbi:MAG TPA: hypothetical protein DEP87_01050 [Candidatus Pacebacteria bacterium]|nr:hypothetical protein [Candidatus Paceibacterota bacterium]